MGVSGCLKGVQRVFHGCFKDVLRDLKSVSRKFPECLNKVSRVFHGSLKGSFTEVSRLFPGSFKGISSRFQ